MAEDPRAALLTSWHIEAPILEAAAEPRPAGSRLMAVKGNPRHVRVREEGDGSWPATTDQWCWYCCHPFQTQPLPMPIKYDDRRQIFHVMGTFCSWACIKAYNLQSASYMKSVNANNITLFHRKCTGKLRGIRSAPPRQALAVFGGTMSIEEFRAASELPVEYCVLPPKMIVHNHAIQETYDAHAAPRKRPSQGDDLATVVNFKDVSTKNETLRLKRPKPLQSNRNLLERTMGIGALTVSAP